MRLARRHEGGPLEVIDAVGVVGKQRTRLLIQCRQDEGPGLVLIGAEHPFRIIVDPQPPAAGALVAEPQTEELDRALAIDGLR